MDWKIKIAMNLDEKRNKLKEENFDFSIFL